MQLRELFFDTLRTLWAHKLRTGLTMFGISWGIISIILMVAAGEGLRVRVTDGAFDALVEGQSRLFPTE